ncbi:hypothetical protein [Micromonospora sp. NPDC000442]|uniref:hypothetical protein n=1 Tax=Micromonospora sp. NPDC000442 TaxID=3364217 RepID=UPI0036A25CA5
MTTHGLARLDGGRQPMLRRLVPVVALLFLAPWAAECSWGGFAGTDMLLVVVVLAPMYGGAAVLIREAARRTGGGWPMIVLLAAGFGVVQAGLVDQSLFNPDYLADTEFAELSAADRTRVPVLGISAQEAISFLGNHVALTICAPIAIVESYLSPARRLRPWLRAPGLVAMTVVYLLGSLLVFADDSGRKGFLASPGQLIGATSVVLALVVVAALPRCGVGRCRLRPAHPDRSVPACWSSSSTWVSPCSPAGSASPCRSSPSPRWWACWSGGRDAPGGVRDMCWPVLREHSSGRPCWLTWCLRTHRHRPPRPCSVT